MKQQQQGMVLVFALIMLLCVTLLGVAAVSTSLSQTKMANSVQAQGLPFDAAEAAIAGVVFESEDQIVLSDVNLDDPLTAARQGLTFDPQTDTLECVNDTDWINRQLTSGGLKKGQQNTATGNFHTQPDVTSWSRTAFVQEKPCRGSSNVIGSGGLRCHVFVVRGCGQIDGKRTITANSLTVAVFGPSSEAQ